MEEWKEYELGALIKLSSGGTPDKKNDSYWGGQIPWISAKSMYDDYLYSSDLTITDEGLENGSRLAPVNSILLLTRGSGLFNRIPVCLVKKEMAFNQDVKCLESKDQNVVSNLFLFYWLMGHKHEISAILETTGIGAGKIDTERFKKIKINLPPIDTQKALVEFTESLMLKIEVNRRINDNLEQQAQALFKSWFVDFEPFKDGEFVESEMGMIPKGWTVRELDEIIEISKQSINPNKIPEIMFTHYSIPAYDREKQPDTQLGKEILSNKFVVRDNMTLFSKLNPRIKRIWYVGDILENSICSTEFVPFLAKDSALSVFVFSLVSSQGFYDYILSMVNGATGSHQRFHPEETLSYKIAYNQEIALEYNAIAEPMITQILKNQQESRRLAQLRDTLLPRLMSGDLKVNEVDCLS